MPFVKRRPPARPVSPDGRPAAGAHAFAAAEAYRAACAPPPPTVREPPALPPFPFSERHLQAVWFDPHYRPATLRTSDGEPLDVCDPGRWNLEAGPDFLDAHLRIGTARREVRGDVEVHVRPEDWRRHGHGNDPRYRRVVAHVTYWPGPLPPETLPAGAVQVALGEAMGNAMAGDAGHFLADIDVTAYPWAAPWPHPDDRPPPLAALEPPWRESLLEAAGTERLRVKTEAIRAHLQETAPRQVLYEYVLTALGYRHNRGVCRRLARLVPHDLLHPAAGTDPLQAYALLLGVAGLMPSGATRAGDDTETQRWRRALWDHWWKARDAWQDRTLPRAAWRLAGLRPQNHPARRLAVVPALCAGDVTLDARLLALTPRDPAAWMRGADALLNGADRVAYWPHRLAIGGKRTPAPVALLGAPRRAAIITNVFVPFAAASGQDIAALLPRLPAEENHQLLRHTAAALFGADSPPALCAGGLRQQGLMQIFHDFCLPDRLDALAAAAHRWRQTPPLAP